MKYIVALSGGKDSSAMAVRLKELYPNREFEYVITPTGDELPDMFEHWENLERILGSSLKRLPNKTLFEVIEEQNMLPNFRARFCTRIIKIEPFIEYMESLPRSSVMYVGLRADEDGRVGIMSPDHQYEIEFPMKDWNWSIDDVWQYLDQKGISIPERTDCGMCFYQRLPEWKRLLERYPDRFQKYIDLEKRMGHTLRTPGKDTWPTSLKDLRAEILTGRKMRNTKARGSKKCRFCSM